MQRMGRGAIRAFKTIAGMDRDAPATRAAVMLYGFLFFAALVVFASWVTGTPLECVAGNC